MSPPKVQPKRRDRAVTTLVATLVVLSTLSFAVVPASGTPVQDRPRAVDGSELTAINVSESSATDTTTLTLLSYNDIQTAASDPTAMGRLVGLLNARREAHANPTVVVGGGDQVSPSSLSPVSQWRVPVDVLNVADPASEVIGNHDLDYGFEAVGEFSNASEFPWLVANIQQEGGGNIPGTQNYTVVERDGVKIGIVGLVDEAIKPKTAVDFEAKGYKVTDYVDAGQRIATKLKEDKNVDVVIAAAHIGVPDSKELANKTDNIDAIVTGDDEIYYPPQTTSGTVIVEAVARGEYVGEVNLTVSENDVSMASGRLIEINENTSVNQTAKAIVENARSEQLSEVIGNTTVPLDSRFSSNYHDETRWGNLITDAFRAQTGAEVAITNAGGIRGNFVIQPGNITVNDVYTSLPFGNYLVTKRMSGEKLRQFLASQVVTLNSWTGQNYGAEAQLQVSGVTYEWVPHERGAPIRDVYVNGEPLEEDEMYNVTVNSYMAGWTFEDRYGWSMSELKTVDTDYTLYGTAVAQYISANSPVSPPDTNRIRRVDRELGVDTVANPPGHANARITVKMAVPDTVESVNGSSFELLNETSAPLEAESATLKNDTLVVRFDQDAFHRMTETSDHLQLYGAYNDTVYGPQLRYFKETVLNVDIRIPPGQRDGTHGEGHGTAPSHSKAAG